MLMRGDVWYDTGEIGSSGDSENASTLKATTRVRFDTGRWKVRRQETVEINL
jgi:hypothetical protein